MASLPAPIARNPYQILLYGHLKNEGVMVVAVPRLCVGWLWRNRRRVATLHFHWPEGYYRHESSRRFSRAALSWVRLGLFAVRIVVARALGYRIVWTVHQVYPHETESKALDRAAAVVLSRLSHSLIAHDGWTAGELIRELGAVGGKTRVIPHGSYIGVYPEGRSRDDVRAELGISPDAFVLLCFGQVRKYKDVTFLVEAFERAAIDNSVLLVAGAPLDEPVARRLSEAGRRNARVRPVLEHVPDDRVASLFRASDVAVNPRSDGGTSGALILALSLGVPVVAASLPVYEELTGGGRAGWYFEPGSLESLAEALRSAATDPRERAARGRAGLEQARSLAWPAIAARTAAVLRG